MVAVVRLNGGDRNYVEISKIPGVQSTVHIRHIVSHYSTLPSQTFSYVYIPDVCTVHTGNMRQCLLHSNSLLGR